MIAKTAITLYATKEELERLDALCRHLSRHSKADTVRCLINSAYQNFLAMPFANTNNTPPFPSAPIARDMSGEKQE